MLSGNEIIYWVFAGSTALTVAAGLLATRVRREWATTLPMAHVAAAVLVALFGWQSLVYLPGTVQYYAAAVAGIPDPANVEAYQAFVVASAAFVVAAALAVYGTLRRRPWGLVLGIGVAGTSALTAVASSVNLFMINGDPFGPSGLAWNVFTLVAERVVPPLVAIGLLLWPLRSPSTAEAPPVETVDWSTDPSPEAGR